MRAARIEQRLQTSFRPVHLEIVNESIKHNVPPGSETHFKITLASEFFIDKSRVEQHRMVNVALAEELASGLHALSLKTLTPADFARGIKAPLETPNCLGGSKK